MKTCLLAFTFLWLASPLAAQEIDNERSVILWKGSKLNGSFHEGRLFAKSATVRIDGGLIKSGNIVLDMTSFTVTDIEGKWAKKFLKKMKSDEFFDVNKFPTAQLELTSVKKQKARGVLTIKGKSQQVSFRIKQSGKTLVGNLTFDRTKFGMIYRSGNFFKDLGDKVINDEVEVSFKIVLK